MRVRMLRSVVGPVGSFGANRVVELPDEVAQRWITAGLCGRWSQIRQMLQRHLLL